MELKIKCPKCDDKTINWITRTTCTVCDGTGKIEGCELRKKIVEAFPHMTEDDFSRHETDLYVIDSDGKIREWLKKNYEFYTNIQGFMGQKGSAWAGKRCLDIPFAAFYEKHPELLKTSA